MKAALEESLTRCKRVITKMKLAILKQKNVSPDIKYGLSDLEEMLEVISRDGRERNNKKGPQKE